MPQLFLFLFKINLVLLLFALTYYLLLRKLTFYKLNRFFLLLGMVFATVYPFINLTAFLTQHTAPESKLRVWVPQVKENINLLMEARIASLWSIAGMVFYAGLCLMALRLIIQLISLYRVHKKSSSGEVHNFRVRILNDNISPFTFWQNIYINPEIHSEQELNNILEHEHIHVKQWHTVDILLAEISLVFYWFNPGVWLMKRAVKENLEFITDQKILNKGIDRKVYQYSLLGASKAEASIALVNHFNLNDLKKRIIMMNRKRSSKFKLVFYAISVPCLLMLTLAFTLDKAVVKREVLNITGIKPVAYKPEALKLVNNVPAKTALKTRLHVLQVPQNTVPEPDSVKVITFFAPTADTVEQKSPKTVTIKYVGAFKTSPESMAHRDSVLKTVEEMVKGVLVEQKNTPSAPVIIVKRREGMPLLVDSAYNLIGKPVSKTSRPEEIVGPGQIKSITVTGYGTRKVMNIETVAPPKN